jgi:hypothetical protein
VINIILHGFAMKEKALTLGLCLAGVLAVAYGMIRQNHVVFIIGLLLVIAGYLLIRKRLKESLRDKM